MLSFTYLMSNRFYPHRIPASGSVVHLKLRCTAGHGVAASPATHKPYLRDMGVGTVPRWWAAGWAGGGCGGGGGWWCCCCHVWWQAAATLQR